MKLCPQGSFFRHSKDTLPVSALCLVTLCSCDLDLFHQLLVTWATFKSFLGLLELFSSLIAQTDRRSEKRGAMRNGLGYLDF